MLLQRLNRHSGTASVALKLSRTFTSTPAQLKTPSLADVVPQGVQSFNAKQKEFRAKLAEASKPKVEASQFKHGTEAGSVFLNPSSQSQLSPTHFESFSTPTAPAASTASIPFSDKLGLGSLSTSTEPLGSEEPHNVKGKLSSLIYGTKEGREMDQEIELSFSQVLARGKYVHSIVFHEVKPDKVDEYVELVGNWYPRMASIPENKVHLVGSWRTEVGDSDTFGMSLFTYHIHVPYPVSIYS
jgi:hypothetical protein